jgi:prepilin-type processing-associated H-X9-DG protein
MNCPSCGEQNSDDAQSCAHCGEWLAGDHGRLPKTSRLAVSSLFLAAAGLLTLGLTAVAGLIVAAVALVRIRQSRGKLKGTPYAVAGIVLSCLLAYGLFGPRIWRDQTRPKAFHVPCKNNLKQIGLALQIYSTDYGAQFPAGDTAVEVFSTLIDANITRGPYLPDPQVFLCPAAKADLEAWDRLGKLTEETVSYKWVPGLSPGSNPDFILAYDKSPDHLDGRRSVLFVDGHVGFMREEAFQARIARQREEMQMSREPPPPSPTSP